MELRQIQTRAECADLLERCIAQANHHRAHAEHGAAYTFDACALMLRNQLKRMTARIELATFEFHCWSGQASGESNAERAERQRAMAWSRQNRAAVWRGRGVQGLIGRTITVKLKKGN